MDPGVLCPNSTLEAIAQRTAVGARDLAAQSELKRWFAREFGAEVAQTLAAADSAPRED
jgi:hypothetical protein